MRSSYIVLCGGQDFRSYVIGWIILTAIDTPGRFVDQDDLPVRILLINMIGDIEYMVVDFFI